ncbi:MAG: hypothetical protein ACREO0_05520 [Pseudoxanthomonas sp.]
MRIPRTALLTRADLGLIALISAGLILTAVARTNEPAPAASPVITDSRTCAALAVYELATVDDWAQRASIAAATLNAQKTSGADPECGKGLASALSGPFDPIRWQNSLDAVDAVASGSYALPDACARATTILPLRSSPGSDTLSGDAARAQCVIYDLAFVGGDL